MKLEKNKAYPLSVQSNLILYPLFKIKKKKQTNFKKPATEKVSQLYKEIDLAINELSLKEKRMLNQLIWGLTNDYFQFPVPFSRNGEIQSPLIPNQFTKQGEPEAIYPSNIELTAQIVTAYLKESEYEERMLRFKKCVNNQLSVQPDTETLQQAIIDTIQQITELQQTNSYILMAPPVPDRLDYIEAFNKYVHQVDEQKKCHHYNLTLTTLNEEQVLYVCKKCGIRALSLNEQNWIGMQDGFIINEINYKKVKEYKKQIEQTINQMDEMEGLKKYLAFYQMICHSNDIVSISENFGTLRRFNVTIDLPEFLQFYHRSPVKMIKKTAKNLVAAFNNQPLNKHTLSIVRDEINKFQESSLYEKKLSFLEEELHAFAIELHKKCEDMIKDSMPVTFTFGSVVLTRKQLYHVLKFVIILDGDFGINTCADVLAGSKSKKMKEYRLLENPYHGYLSTFSRAKVLEVLERLMYEEYTYRTHSDYPKYKPEKKAHEMLRLLEVLSHQDTDRQKEKILVDLSFESFIEMIDSTQLNEDMISGYMNKHFKESPALFYKKCLDYIRDSGTSKPNEVLIPYLVLHYDDKYKPIFDLIVKSRKGSTYGQFISDLYKRIERKDVVSCLKI
ncbi:RQC domain-containing protein [Niallia endozanthoxylica]|uniref:RQC domain-containing protein n=1 Tax=Niallia endozanthoxylica TaxID=2036016 RepID=A0A5J5HRI7_9BACI|nr:RQC domain-containing protein [Niallia endozanthoxylica]KAA9023924.1 hypothetical protein F4V44_12365 [Niallia endozanthoxylica]